MSVKKASTSLLPFSWATTAAQRAESDQLSSARGQDVVASASGGGSGDEQTGSASSQPAAAAGTTTATSGAGTSTAAVAASAGGAASSTTAVNDAHVSEIVACLKQQLQDQQQILNLLTGKLPQGQGHKS